MKCIAALMISLIFVLPQINAQKKLKIYYDKDWLVVESKKKATYYREITRKSKTDPGGKVKDFFITGELQGEGDAIQLDLKNDANSLWKGKLTGYFQDGKKRFENNYTDVGLPEGTHTQWYVGGLKEIDKGMKEIVTVVSPKMPQFRIFRNY